VSPARLSHRLIEMVEVPGMVGTSNNPAQAGNVVVLD
jgi:hypothetical protein